MSTHPAMPLDRALELLTDRALFGLDEGDRAEFARECAGRSADTIDEFDLAAGAMSVALLGAEYGRGFASCRAGGAGWSAPAAVRLEGGSIGFQAGGQETDIVMLIMNKRGAKRLMKSQFTLGGDASVAAGPVGRAIEAATDAMLTAEILTWSRARGLFAGVSLQGVTLRNDRKANESLYGQPWSTGDVVFSGLEPRDAALPLMNLLNRYSSRPVH